MTNGEFGIESGESFSVATSSSQVTFLDCQMPGVTEELSKQNESNITNNGFKSDRALLEDLFTDIHNEEHAKRASSTARDDADSDSDDVDSVSVTDDVESDFDEQTTMEDYFVRNNSVPPIEGSGDGKLLTKQQVEQVLYERKIERLIDDLDNGGLVTRVKAEAQLLTEGMKAIPTLTRKIDELDTRGPRSSYSQAEKLKDLAQRILDED